MTFKWLDSTIGGLPVKNAALLVPVLINNSPFYLQLDTGTKKSIIYKEFVLSQNLTIQNERIDIQLKIDKSHSNINFKIDADSKIAFYQKVPIIGLLGLDFIKSNRFLFIDFKNRKINFYKKTSLISKAKHKTSTLKLKNGFIIFRAKIEKKFYNFIWDSGASFIDLFVNADLWEYLAHKTTSDKNNEIIKVSGAFDSEHVLIKNKVAKKFELLGKPMKDKNIYCNKTYSPLTDLSTINIDGLIGNTLLLDRKIIFDFNLNHYIINP